MRRCGSLDHNSRASIFLYSITFVFEWIYHLFTPLPSGAFVLLTPAIAFVVQFVLVYEYVSIGHRPHIKN